jgi:hypothetical protein
MLLYNCISHFLANPVLFTSPLQIMVGRWATLKFLKKNQAVPLVDCLISERILRNVCFRAKSSEQ